VDRDGRDWQASSVGFLRDHGHEVRRVKDSLGVHDPCVAVSDAVADIELAARMRLDRAASDRETRRLDDDLARVEHRLGEGRK
jgi:hypothetical protein